MNNDTRSSYQEAFDYLTKTVQMRPKIGVVCGSGLGGFADTLSDVVRFDYKDIPHCPVSTVEGHKVSYSQLFGYRFALIDLSLVVDRPLTIKSLYEK